MTKPDPKPGPELVDSDDDLIRAIVHAQQVSPQRVPLLQAVLAGGLVLAELTREAEAPWEQLGSVDRPAIVLACDNDGLSTGPDGWAGALRFAGWAECALLIAGRGTSEEYADAVATAAAEQRLVVVEIDDAHAMAWHLLFASAGIPTVAFLSPARDVGSAAEKLH